MTRYKFPAPAPESPLAHTGADSKRQHPADVYPTVLETRFPHVLHAVMAMWGYQELNSYFDQLSVDKRGGRKGFPADAWDEISLLLSMHQDIYPLPSY